MTQAVRNDGNWIQRAAGNSSCQREEYWWQLATPVAAEEQTMAVGDRVGGTRMIYLIAFGEKALAAVNSGTCEIPLAARDRVSGTFMVTGGKPVRGVSVKGGKKPVAVSARG